MVCLKLTYLHVRFSLPVGGGELEDTNRGAQLLTMASSKLSGSNFRYTVTAI